MLFLCVEQGKPVNTGVIYIYQSYRYSNKNLTKFKERLENDNVNHMVKNLSENPWYLINFSKPCLSLSLRYNQQALSLDFLELLERFIPSDYELKLLQNYEKEGRPLEDLSEEDRFIMRFGKIKRLAQRISTLTFMGNFSDTVKRLQPVSAEVNKFIFPHWHYILLVPFYQINTSCSNAFCSNWTPSSQPLYPSSLPPSWRSS